MKEAEIITKYLSSTLEVIAALVIGISLLKFLYKYFFHIFKPNDGITNQTIRIQFGSGLTVALELLLAADILATAIAPRRHLCFNRYYHFIVQSNFSVFLLILAGALIAIFFLGLSGLICRKT